MQTDRRLSLFSELKRRNVLRTAGLYIVAAWLLLQAAEVFVGLEALPSSIGRPLLIVLAIGFPIAIVLAWLFDLGPEGIQREAIDASEHTVPQPRRRFDLLVIAGMISVGGYLAFEQFAAPDSEPVTDASRMKQRSIAVLPFANLGANSAEDYFADGLAEQLMALLTRIPGLAVTSRTSAFAFRASNKGTTEIASELGVAYLLAGSFQSLAGNTRFSVELIKADQDQQVWSESFELSSVDVSVALNKVTKSIAQNLQVSAADQLPETRITDAVAHRLFLRGMYAHSLGSKQGYEDSLNFCQQSIAQDPTYAPAWECSASAYTNLSNRNVLPPKTGYELAKSAARKALMLESRSALAYRTLAYIANYHDGDLQSAAELLEQALLVAPGDAGALGGAALLLSSLGRTKEAVPLAERAATRDPLSAVVRGNLAAIYFWDQRFEDALDQYRIVEALAADSFALNYRLGESLLALDRREEAHEHMVKEKNLVYSLVGQALTAADAAASRQPLEQLMANHSDIAAYNIAYALAYTGDTDGAFVYLEKELDLSGTGVFSEILGDHWFAPLKDDPRWQPFLTKVGRSEDQLTAVQLIIPASAYAAAEL